MAVRTTSHALFSLFFPDSCRICGDALRDVRRYPVCAKCIKAPEPLSAEYFCSSCRTPFQNAFPLDEEGRCALCRSGLRGFDAAYCFGAYEGALRELIHLYKYGKIRTLAPALGGFMAQAFPRDEAFDALVPVPLYWRRQWQRGFNQAELLARIQSQRTGIPVIHALRRVRATPNQAGLSNSERRKNMSQAFRIRGKSDKPTSEKPMSDKPMAGKRLLLIDDVLTTGSTAAACALALKMAGARRVAILTVARVDRRMESWRLKEAYSNSA